MSLKDGLSSTDVPEKLSGPEGLLFTGDAIRSLTPEKVAAIDNFASSVFGVEMRVIKKPEGKHSRPLYSLSHA